MKINLKKSAVLQIEIIKRIEELSIGDYSSGDLNLSLHVDIQPFEDYNKIIDERMEVVRDAIVRVTNLEKALTEVRKLTGLKNAEVGVTALLADQNHHERMIKRLNIFKSAESIRDNETIRKQLEMIENPESEKSRYNHSVRTGVFSKDFLDDIKLEIRSLHKKVRDVKDSLTEINFTNKIELSEETVATLEEEMLL